MVPWSPPLTVQQEPPAQGLPLSWASPLRLHHVGTSPPSPTPAGAVGLRLKGLLVQTDGLPVDSELLETFHPAVLGAVHGHHGRDAHYTHPLRRARHAQLYLLVLINNPIGRLQLQRLRPARSRRDLDGFRRCCGCCLCV